MSERRLWEDLLDTGGLQADCASYIYTNWRELKRQLVW